MPSGHRGTNTNSNYEKDPLHVRQKRFRVDGSGMNGSEEDTTSFSFPYLFSLLLQDGGRVTKTTTRKLPTTHPEHTGFLPYEVREDSRNL